MWGSERSSTAGANEKLSRKIASLCSSGEPPTLRGPSRLAVSYFGFMYQKIASATSATVMIHRTMSLLRFFSSAMKKSTPQVKFRFKCRFDFPGEPPSGYGFAAAAAAPARL
jgi:hypothetical protein